MSGASHAETAAAHDGRTLSSATQALLLGDWQSLRLGHVVVRRRPGLEEAAGAVATLDVCFCKADAVESHEAIGHLRNDDGRIALQVKDSQNKLAKRWPALKLWLDTQRSKRRRVLWKDAHGEDVDVWDCELLHMIRAAAVWVKNQNIESYIDATGHDAFCNLHRCAKLTESPVSVALCVTTMNRLWQLERALPLNLLHCWRDRKWTRFHVVDFGSSDGTLSFLLNKCRPAIDCGLLAVYTTDQLQFWHASIAKNTAHAVASEDILVNLDGDNLIGPAYTHDVVRRFNEEGYTVMHSECGQGTCGRIACYRRDFAQLRGYDEDCYPMGAQDVDLLLRLREMPGARWKKRDPHTFPSQAIPNTIEAKVSGCDPEYGGLRWGQMDAMNREVFSRRRAAGQLARNLDRSSLGVKVWKVDAPGCLPEPPPLP